MGHHHRSRKSSKSSGINLASLLGNIDLAGLLQSIDISTVIDILGKLNSLKGNTGNKTLFKGQNIITRASESQNSPKEENNQEKTISEEQITSVLSKFNVGQDSLDRIVDVLSGIKLQKEKLSNEENKENEENPTKDD